MTPLQACTQLLVHFDEVNGQYVDTSVFRRAITQNATGTAPSHTVSGKFGGAVVFANELSRNYVVSAIVDTRAPFYVEAWVMPTAPTESFSAEKVIFETSSPGMGFGLEASSLGRKWYGYLANANNSRTYCRSPSAAVNGAYVHVLFGQDETFTQRLFLDGVQVSSSSGAMNPHRTESALFGIGGNSSSSFTSPHARIDELRYVVGLPCPTTNFTPPVAPYADIPRSLIDAAQPVSNPVRVFQAAQIPAANLKVGPPQPTLLFDRIDGGRGIITGTVKEKSSPSNLPLMRRVRLHDELTGRLVRETWSDAVTGNYMFAFIDQTRRYTVITYDHVQNYRAVVADNILPETMP